MSGTSVLSEKLHSSMEEPYKISMNYKRIYFNISLQRDRKKLFRLHRIRNFPQSNVKTSLDAEILFVSITEKKK